MDVQEAMRILGLPTNLLGNIKIHELLAFYTRKELSKEYRVLVNSRFWEIIRNADLQDVVSLYKKIDTIESKNDTTSIKNKCEEDIKVQIELFYESKRFEELEELRQNLSELSEAGKFVRRKILDSIDVSKLTWRNVLMRLSQFNRGEKTLGFFYECIFVEMVKNSDDYFELVRIWDACNLKTTFLRPMIEDRMKNLFSELSEWQRETLPHILNITPPEILLDWQE